MEEEKEEEEEEEEEEEGEDEQRYQVILLGVIWTFVCYVLAMFTTVVHSCDGGQGRRCFEVVTIARCGCF